MTDRIPIKTIGYGNRSIEEFLEVLKQHEIEYLIDVRSVPYSRYKPEFSKPALESFMKQHNIRYVYMGEELGGIPKVQDGNNSKGKVDYNSLKEHASYKRGIDRLYRAFEQGRSIALMCSEGKPENCHRSKLIGQTLTEEKHVEVNHIDDTDGLIPHSKVMERIPEYNQLSLLPEEVGYKSRKNYPQ